MAKNGTINEWARSPQELILEELYPDSSSNAQTSHLAERHGQNP
jgi:hypothetical protein